MRTYKLRPTAVQSNAEQVAATPAQRAVLRPPVQRHGDHQGQKESLDKGHAAQDRMTRFSHRFKGDPVLEQIGAGTLTLTNYSQSLQARKLQQGLVDAGYDVGTHGVDGKFGDDTETGLKQFQHDAGITETGAFDKATFDALETKYQDRQPYIDHATFDPADPDKGLRNLSWTDRKAVQDALVPARGTGGKASTFQETVGGEDYGPVMEKHLQDLIAALHKDLFADKEPLRKDPGKNFHDWSVLEGTAAASKAVTDKVYGSYATGAPLQNEVTDPISGAKSQGNLIDQWEDELVRNSGLNAANKKEKARDKVWYFIASNCRKINNDHSAVPTASKEKAILTPIVERFIDTPAKVQTLLETDVGWEGAQLEGTIYLQRFKQDTDEKNIAQLYELFHVCIHEYIHGLAHEKFLEHAGRQNSTRYNTLVEGFCDFFTENVRQTLNIDDSLQQDIEGPYYKKGNKVPKKVNAGVYPSIVQAEQVVSIVGVRNAQAAYFQGKTKYMRGTT